MIWICVTAAFFAAGLAAGYRIGIRRAPKIHLDLQRVGRDWGMH